MRTPQEGADTVSAGSPGPACGGCGQRGLRGGSGTETPHAAPFPLPGSLRPS